MTTAQKIIKYAAIALALTLIIGIISGAIFTAYAIFERGEELLDNVEEIRLSDGSITDLSIDIGALELRLINSDSFKLESNLKDLSVKQKDGKLSISHKNNSFISFSESKGTILLYVPENFTFEKVDISVGAGKLTGETLSASKITMDMGAGKAEFSGIYANKGCKIDVGAGKLVIKNGSIANLDLKVGVGNLTMSAILTGTHDIECGVGNVDLILKDSEDHYRFSIEKGLGNVKIDGKKMKDDSVFGKGENRISIDCGVGNVTVKFEQKNENE